MRTGHERFVTDKDGKRIAVLLDVDEYVSLLQELEELEALKLSRSRLSSVEPRRGFFLSISVVFRHYWTGGRVDPARLLCYIVAQAWRSGV